MANAILHQMGCNEAFLLPLNVAAEDLATAGSRTTGKSKLQRSHHYHAANVDGEGFVAGLQCFGIFWTSSAYETQRTTHATSAGCITAMGTAEAMGSLP
jgi:hypothetical protein